MSKSIVAGVMVLLIIGGVAGFYLYTVYLPGTVVLRITDPPGGGQSQYPPSITHINITYTSIDIHASGLATSSNAGWHTIVASGSLDLLTVVNKQEVLGSTRLPTGRYDMIRMMASTATVTLSGADHSYNIPSGKIQVLITRGGFQVSDQQTVDVLLTLSFNSSEILALGPNLNPVAKAEVVP